MKAFLHDVIKQIEDKNNHPIPCDVLMELFLESSRRVAAKGKRPLPYVPEAEDELNEAWRICLLGWADMEYFKKALDKWERVTGGYDSGHRQETMKF